jgi:hypothetical protein
VLRVSLTRLIDTALTDFLLEQARIIVDFDVDSKSRQDGLEETRVRSELILVPHETVTSAGLLQKH